MKALITTAAIVAAFAPLAAQQAGTTAGRPPAEPGPAHNTYVLVGCLEADATPAPVAAFSLTNASAVGQAPPEADTQPSAVGTGGAAAGNTADLRRGNAAGNAAGGRAGSGSGGTPANRVYQLQANTTSSVTQPGLTADALKAEVGHRVQVTVRALDVDAPPPVSETNGGATRATAANTEARATARFAVTALTQLDTRCR